MCSPVRLEGEFLPCEHEWKDIVWGVRRTCVPWNVVSGNCTASVTLAKLGFDPALFGMHSLHAGGATVPANAGGNQNLSKIVSSETVGGLK